MTCPNCQSDTVINRASQLYLFAVLLTAAGFLYLLVIAFTNLRTAETGVSDFTGTFYLLIAVPGLLWNLWLIRRWFRNRARPYLCRNCGHEWADAS